MVTTLAEKPRHLFFGARPLARKQLALGSQLSSDWEAMGFPREAMDGYIICIHIYI
jgi:hypothetical protein